MKKVLVVQDERLNGGLNVQLLEEEYEVLTANDGIEALQMALWCWMSAYDPKRTFAALGL